mgnify:CR=1 FL=1
MGQILTALEPGEVSPPVRLPNALAFFQLREVGEVPSNGTPTQLDYAALYLPGGRSEETLQRAAQIAADADTCTDLQAIGGRIGAATQADTLPVAQVPQDVALELAQLDPGEVSMALTRAEGQTLVVLMLCNRIYRAPDAEEPNLGQVRASLGNRLTAQQAENYLAELRANARIRYE